MTVGQRQSLGMDRYAKRNKKTPKAFKRDVVVKVRIKLNGFGKLSSVSTTNVCRRDGDVLLNTLEDELQARFLCSLKQNFHQYHYHIC